jgi:2,3,4,5-tetrahydropyridine-2-carboxylate N-succinyltransferase
MTDTATLQALIETAFEKRADINPRNITRELRIALDECLDLLDSGGAPLLPSA